MSFFYLKALHIIFVVTWFAGLFYIVRLFIYHQESFDKPENEGLILRNQFKIMERRLWYGITWPSMVLALIFGFSLFQNFLPLNENPWLITKLGFVFFLVIYHHICGHIYKQIQVDTCKWTSASLRLWNEVATLFLVCIILLVVLKDMMSFYKGFACFIIFMLIAFGLVKYFRNKKSVKGA